MEIYPSGLRRNNNCQGVDSKVDFIMRRIKRMLIFNSPKTTVALILVSKAVVFSCIPKLILKI